MRGLGTVLLLLVLAACGGDEEPSGDGGGPTAAEVSTALQDAIPEAENPVTITEDNDPNDLIGRPGQYVAAVSLHDSRMECGTDDLDVSCGAKIEEFGSADDAEKRRDYIAEVTEGIGALAEYDYLLGTVLLRVSGDLKPSEAAEYEAALQELG